MLQQTKDGVILFLKVIPKSSFTQIVGIENEYLKVRIKAQPEKNKANTMLIKFLAKLFDIPASQIKILSGETSRLKKILLISASIDKIEAIVKKNI
ncbi:MAG: YggU family protein [Chlamydiae bacterium]|nr:YggU family protein [Chlamydiota bacterium]